ncbi:MAG: efflux RND transporter periplasmic adaptor subunit [Thermaerobacter sp.]|nr:efflux RND transporter periplasmic adaptor subunit [Thermaerobacter sp.]
MPEPKTRRGLSMPRVVGLAGGTTVVLAGLVYAVVAAGHPSTTGRYLTAPVRRGSVSLTYQATGDLIPAQTATFTTPGNATLSSLAVHTGEAVSSGQVLAVFADPGLAGQLASANASLLTAESQLAALQAPTHTAAASSAVQVADAALAVASAAVTSDQAAVSALTVTSTAAGTVTLLVSPGQTVAAAQPVATEGGTTYTSPVAGTVGSVHVSSGARVSAGQPLATISDPSLLAKLAADQATVIQDRIAVTSAEAAGGSASQAAALAVAQATVSADQSTVTSLRQAVGSLTATAPFAGEVVFASSSGATAKVVAVDSLDRQVTVPVPETELSSVHTGQSVVVTLPAYPGQKFSGAVSSVAPVGTYANGVSSFAVQIAVTSMPHVAYYGLSANVVIGLRSVHGQLVVPLAALGARGGHTVVRVLQGSHVSVVPVKVVLESTATAAVASPHLSVGARVIIAQPTSATGAKKLRTKGRAVRGGAARKGHGGHGGGKP